MPGRDFPIITDGIYHIYNKTLDGSRIFLNESLCSLFCDLIFYYRSTKAINRHSFFRSMSTDEQNRYEKLLMDPRCFYVEIYCHTFMPNHFHLLVKQKKDGGVSFFMSQLINSFTRFYNRKFNHNGSIFFSPFRCVQIKTREQFIHIARYIHLNAYSSQIVSNIEDLISYPWSSLNSYLFGNPKEKFLSLDFLLGEFNNSTEKLKQFTFDNADYQRSLEFIKHIQKWEKKNTFRLF